MDENLVGYVLKCLDPATQERVESQLRTDPQARERLELLRQMLTPLEEDREIPCPPDLVVKTLALTAEQFLKQAPRLLPCYAYSLGYRDETGVYHCAMEATQTACARVPLMADGPPPGVGNSLNSTNHGGRGQNVLFNDGHVEFCVSRHVGGDDIYLNRDLKVGAGVDCNDAVLGSSAAHP